MHVIWLRVDVVGTNRIIKETFPTTKKGWVIIHPDGEIETDYFQRTIFDDKGFRVSAKRWREIYRPRCKMVKGTLSWVSTG